MRSLFVFSGLASLKGPPIEALRELRNRPENVRFFATAFEAVTAAFDHVGPGAYRRYLPGGMPLERWLGGEEPAPAQRTHSVVDGICAHIYQLCLLQPQAGDPAQTPDDDGPGTGSRPVATLGHSLGVQAAVAAALQVRRRRDFLRVSYDSIVLAAVILLRCHQVDAATPGPDDVRRRYLDRVPAGGSPPGPMAAVGGLTTAELGAMVAGHDRETHGPVEIAIVNSGRSHVLAGAPASLVAFWLDNEERLAASKVRWSFLPSTAPFHTSLMEPAVALLRADEGFIGYNIAGGQLALPVYVAEAPHNLQDRPGSFGHFLEQAIARPVDWYATVTTAVAASRPELVIDFGPGPAARVFTRECLRQVGYSLRYRTVTHRR